MLGARPGMICPACGSRNLPDARFCSSCGARMPDHTDESPSLGGDQLAQEMAAVRPAVERGLGGPAPDARQAALFAARMRARCPHCGTPASPMPYFSRGVNVGKAVALMLPFNVLGPLVFFLFRKDRVICSACMRVLPGERALPLLDAFSSDGARALQGPAGADALMNVLEAERDLAVLDARHRRLRGRAVALAIVSAGFGALALAGGAGDGQATMGLMIMGLPAALAAAWSTIRSRALGREVMSKRQRQRTLGVLSLARAHGGRLSVTLVASELSLDLQEAERLLDSLVDGRRVDLQVDDAGRVSYVFPELID